MTGVQFVTRILKPLIWVGCLGPLAWLVRGLLIGHLGADPVITLQHTTGLTALILLLTALAVTPIRRLTGFNALVRARRLFGLFAFFYAVLHLTTYLVFDQELDVGRIAKDVKEHPWVLVGFSAFLILLSLAVTSPKAAVRRLGGKRWQALHRAIYAAGILVFLHFLWLVKKDIREPLLYGAILGVLLLARLVPWALKVGRARAAVAKARVESRESRVITTPDTSS